MYLRGMQEKTSADGMELEETRLSDKLTKGSGTYD